MPQDYMSPMDEGGEGQAMEGSKPKPEQAQNSAMLPKSLFGGQEMEVGSSLCVKIVAVHGEEVEVALDSEKKEEESEGEGQSKDMADVMGKIDAMAK